MQQAPLGIFDSGLGGLTIFSALHRHLPHEALIYLGDTARLPYGNKSAAVVIRYAKEDAEFLIKRGVKVVVVACNTASSYALKYLQQEFRLPIFGVIEPGAHAAIKSTRNKRIGVLGTRGTIASGMYEHVLKQLNPSLQVISQACPLLVPLIEEGWHEEEVTRSIAKRYVLPLKAAEVDTVILGCTHYPLLKPLFQEIFGPQVALIDAGQVLAEELKQFLQAQQSLATHASPALECWVTDIPQRFSELAQSFFGDQLPAPQQAVLGDG